MNKKSIIVVTLAVAFLVLIGTSVFIKNKRETEYKRFVIAETKLELDKISKTLNGYNEDKWVEVERRVNNYTLKVERSKKIELLETEYLTKESVIDGDTETIIYKDRDGKDRLDITINYYDAPKLAILIDDVGMNTHTVKNFAKIDRPLTFATLPFLPRSREATKMLKELGYDVILHMPMAGSSDSLNSRTDGILLTSMSRKTIYDRFDKALEDVGPVEGFNNHMGSRFTSNDKKMRELLEYAKRKGLYYIDSNTSRHNLGYPISKELGIPTYYCSHFIDNSKKLEDIKKEIKVAVEMSKNNGEVLVIGHYHPVTALAIEQMQPYIEDQGIMMVYAKDLLETSK